MPQVPLVGSVTEFTHQKEIIEKVRAFGPPGRPSTALAPTQPS